MWCESNNFIRIWGNIHNKWNEHEYNIREKILWRHSDKKRFGWIYAHLRNLKKGGSLIDSFSSWAINLSFQEVPWIPFNRSS